MVCLVLPWNSDSLSLSRAFIIYHLYVLHTNTRYALGKVCSSKLTVFWGGFHKIFWVVFRKLLSFDPEVVRYFWVLVAQNHWVSSYSRESLELTRTVLFAALVQYFFHQKKKVKQQKTQRNNTPPPATLRIRQISLRCLFPVFLSKLISWVYSWEYMLYKTVQFFRKRECEVRNFPWCWMKYFQELQFFSEPAYTIKLKLKIICFLKPKNLPGLYGVIMTRNVMCSLNQFKNPLCFSCDLRYEYSNHRII